MLMAAAALPALKTQPLREYRVLCEVEAHDGIHQFWLMVLAADEDEASDLALQMLDQSCVKDVVRKAKSVSAAARGQTDASGG